MIVLHGTFHDGHFLVWGEMPLDAKRRIGKYASPYEAEPKALAALLARAGLKFPKKSETEAVAWLPSSGDRPLPSSSLIAPDLAPSGKTQLEPWMVASIALFVRECETLLAMCAARELAGEKVLEPGAVIGDDLFFWAGAFRFAGALVTRQQFLPDLISTGEGFAARWTPVIAGADRQRLHELARAMPAVARALADHADHPPETPAQSVLVGFVAWAVDGMVRQPGAAPPKGGFDSLHDQWLYALRCGDGAMTGPPSELQSLRRQVAEWRRPVEVAASAEYRLCFQMEEPPDQSGPWQVRYLLQGAHDPSLLVPAEEAWLASGKGPLARKAPAIREQLLVSLAQAAGVCPQIEASLKTPKPAGYMLDTTGAFEFLTTRAGALEQNGFGVLLPSWWTRAGAGPRLAVRASVKSPAMAARGGLSLDTVLMVDWQVAMGGDPLSLAELKALAALKVPLVRIRGQWVQAGADAIRAAIEFLKKRSGQTVTLRDVVRMAVGAEGGGGPLAVEGVSATGWVADVLARLNGKADFEELPQPAELRGTLRPYQTRGFSWLAFLRQWGLGACLADDMGLGKTIQTLALIQHTLASDGGESRPVLLIAPTSVVGNWQKEAARFAPQLPVLVHHGVTRAKGPSFRKEASRHAVVLSTYALLHRDFDILKEIPWAGVILDEAQNIKNPETKQAHAARALTADYRIALTGTPVENNIGDLWSIMDFLNPGLLGNQSEFRKRFFTPIQLYGDQRAAEKLKQISGPFVLRRLKTDKSIIADLPDKLEMKVYCNLTREQASLYAAVVKDVEDALDEAEGIQRKGLVLATLAKLKQVCNHPAQFLKDGSEVAGRSGKLARLTEMLEEVLAEGDRALVFTQFTEMGGLLRQHLEYTFGREVLYLHGGVTKKKRDAMVERFSAPGGPPVFLLSLKAGGTGLNLTGANHVFHYDRWWNPAVENQATDRAFRIGQTRNVQVHKFICAGTLEDKIDDMIERKKEIAGLVVGAGEGWLTELSNSELRSLFALSKDAAGGA